MFLSKKVKVIAESIQKVMKLEEELKRTKENNPSRKLSERHKKETAAIFDIKIV